MKQSEQASLYKEIACIGFLIDTENNIGTLNGHFI